MNLQMKTMGNSLIVKLSGELDHHSSENVRLKIDNSFISNNLFNIVMDLNELTFMDSSGIGLIMGRYRNVNEKKGEILIACENESIKRILDMSGLFKIIKLYPDLDTAIKNIKTR
ncbi:MAG: anti-sigma F factor antagonist [Tissierellaceae bacterium]|nr:anti-sigma F factor antagonist [Tissierellaceae bacterium]